MVLGPLYFIRLVFYPTKIVKSAKIVISSRSFSRFHALRTRAYARTSGTFGTFNSEHLDGAKDTATPFAAACPVVLPFSFDDCTKVSRTWRSALGDVAVGQPESDKNTEIRVPRPYGLSDCPCPLIMGRGVTFSRSAHLGVRLDRTEIIREISVENLLRGQYRLKYTRVHHMPVHGV